MERYAPEGIPVERADCRSGAIVSDRFLLDELGDFLPNVAALTPLLGHPGPLAWSLALVARSRDARFRRGGLFDAFAYHRRRWRRARGLGFAFPYWNLDSLTGLVALYEIARALGRPEEPALRADVAAFAEALVRRGTRHGHLRYGYHPALGFALPLSSPQLTGYAAEELIRFAGLGGERWCLDAAVALLRAEYDSPGFARHGVLCARVHGPAAPLLRAGLRRLGKRHFERPMLAKDNSLPAFALLALARAAPEHAPWALATADRWRRAVDARFRLPSGHYATYAGDAAGPATPTRLTFNHALIEWDIEAHVATGRAEPLERAVDLARRWVALRTPRGLFPEGPEPPWRECALLDAQVDLGVNLLKLAELTGDRAWRQLALDNLAAIRRDFRLAAGYAWAVDSATGAVREPVIEVKYLGLLLKAFLGARAAAAGACLRTWPLLWMLLRDR
jgi:hypothetical protein